MSWIAFAAAYVLAAVFLVGPGYAFLAALRVPAWSRLLLAPVVSAAWVAGLAIVMAWVHVRFDGWTVLAATAVLAVVLAALTRAPRATAGAGAPSPLTWLALGTAILVSLVVWTVEYVRPLAGPAAVLTGYDVPWHGAIIRQFVTTGDGSSLTAATVDHTVGSTFYPAGWHDMVALVAGLGHVPVFGAVNAVTAAELTLLWPLGIVGFTTALLGRRPTPVLAAGVLGCAFAAFPLHLVTFGIVYSNTYGFILLPALLGLGVALLGDPLLGDPAPEAGRRLGMLLFAVGLVGTALAQPNTVFTLVLILLPPATAAVHRRAGRRRAVLGWLAGTGLVILVAAVWVALAHTAMMHRTVSLGIWVAGSLRAAIIAVALQQYAGDRQWILALLVVLGALILLVLRRRRWLIVSHLLVCLGYLVSASTVLRDHAHWLRVDFTGFWYNDFHRLAAATVLTAVPLAVAAVDRGVLALAAHRDLLRRPHIRIAAGAAIAVVVLAATAGALASAPFRVERAVVARRSAPQALMPSARLAFLDKVARIAAGRTVANDPFDGSPFAYSLDGVDTFFKSRSANWIGRPSHAMRVVADDLDEAASRRGVCRTLRHEDVGYALTMPTGHRLIQWPIRGQHITPATPGFRLVARGAGAALYKITACGRTAPPSRPDGQRAGAVPRRAR